VLKSGCSIERRRLAALDHMQRALALYSVIAWRVLTVTLLARAQPDLPCTALLDDDEWQALYCAIHQTTHPPAVPPPLADAVRWIAQLGGFLFPQRRPSVIPTGGQPPSCSTTRREPT